MRAIRTGDFWLEKGNDETSYYQDYYYIKAISVEVMNQRGQEDIEN